MRAYKKKWFICHIPAAHQRAGKPYIIMHVAILATNIIQCTNRIKRIPGYKRSKTQLIIEATFEEYQHIRIVLLKLSPKRIKAIKRKWLFI